MSPPILACPICGWIILKDEGSVSWMNQFRGVYSGPEGIVLTGVGLFIDPRESAWIAPPDPQARWDDPGYKRREEDQSGAMTRIKWNGRRGFVFHNACWSLLEQAFHPASVPIARVFEVCDSLSAGMLHDRVDWGHDYGGLAFKRDDFFPWEERFADRRGDRRQFPEADQEFDHTPYCADPLAVEEVDAILGDTLQEAPGGIGDLPLTFFGRDPFGSIPVELCLAIVAHLPTEDALNARLASKSFWPLFGTQQFWASRFRGGLDRSWLFIARQINGARDWRSLYRRTTHGRLGQGLRNRKRIWSLIQGMAPILELRLNNLSSALPPPWTALPDESRQWVLAGGNMEHEPFEYSQLEKGCKRFWSRQVAIPEDLSEVTASTVRVGQSVYIGGIGLTTAAGEVLRLGYFGTSESSLQVSGLTGFNVAVGLSGIHAIQFIDGGSGAPSAWLGCPDDAPKTERLAMGARIAALEVAFDGLRMVSIAVSPKPNAPTPGAHMNDKLRRSAIWYPDLPPAALNLNENFFPQLPSYTWGYRPLFWACFGGPRGIYLGRLIKIAVSWSYLQRIDFTFDGEVPAKCHSFGRWQDTEFTERVEFPIDGPGGERIERVDIFQQYPREYDPKRDYSTPAEWYRLEGTLESLKIFTNHGRERRFGKRPSSRKNIVLRQRFVAAPGSVITGFYGAQYRSLALPVTSLGILTDTLREA